MMNKERERENAERNKKEKEGETLGVLSLFFLPVVSFFANTRDDREQSRTFYVSIQLLLFWTIIYYYGVVVVVVVFHVAREKKVMTFGVLVSLQRQKFHFS
tara:strand:- start:209 stop:511 length:303 start_codon:yes stop_codon:yes gene_type:complete